MRTATYVAALLLSAWACSLGAQPVTPTLSARLVTASKEGGSTDARLADVLPLLQSTLSFTSFRLEGEVTLPFRAGATATLAKGYRLELSQVQESNAMVRVSQDARDLVQTKLALREGRPVIVGGFDDPAGGKTIIILKLQ